jgi:hypothetical protein
LRCFDLCLLLSDSEWCMVYFRRLGTRYWWLGSLLKSIVIRWNRSDHHMIKRNLLSVNRQTMLLCFIMK